MTELPEPILHIAQAAKGGRTVPMAIWRLYMVLQEMGWTVELNKPIRNVAGRWERNSKPSLVVSHPFCVGIEVGKNKPRALHLKRLEGFEGMRVIILMWSKRYEPWQDKRSEFNRVRLEQLEPIQYIVSANNAQAVIHTPETLRGDQERVIAAREERDRVSREKAFEARLTMRGYILEAVEQAWRDRLPISTHGNVTPDRRLQKIMKQQYDMPEKITEELVREMKKEGKLSTGKHSYTKMSGLKKR